MRRIPLGRTGLTVTPIGLGLAALGRPGYIDLGRAEDLGPVRSVEGMEQRAHATLDAALEVGIGYVDAARSYGRAEEFLASWLDRRGDAAREITVGSKWGYTYTAGWRVDAEVHEVKDHSLATLRRQIAESRSLLGDRLSLYQIHSATLESGVLDDVEVLRELGRLRDEGLVIGMSVSGPRQADVVRRGLELELDGTTPFAEVQATWNPLEPSAGPALAEAHEAGWGVLVKEAMANGRLGPRGEGALEAIAERHGATLDAVAIAAVLAQPWADVVLSGAVTPDQLRSNATALQLRLSPDEVDEVPPEAPDVYWARRSTLRWS